MVSGKLENKRKFNKINKTDLSVGLLTKFILDLSIDSLNWCLFFFLLEYSKNTNSNYIKGKHDHFKDLSDTYKIDSRL